jgi:hypothetical protein
LCHLNLCIMMYVQLSMVVAGYGMWGGNLTIFE